MPTVNAQTTGIQLERVSKKIQEWFNSATIFYTALKKVDTEEVSSRNMRIPIKLSKGTSIAQYSADGGVLPAGTGARYDVAQVTPVSFIKAFGMTKQTEYSTNSDKKAVVAYTKTAMADAIEALNEGLEGMTQSDGSGVLGEISAVATNTFTVPNSNVFRMDQSLQVFSALGGTLRGSCVVQGIDAVSSPNTITVDAAPAGTIPNDLLIVAGAPGTASSSLFGIEYHNTAATTGTWLSLSRATYPQLRSVHVSNGNAPLTTDLPRKTLFALLRKNGNTMDQSGLIWHCGTDIAEAWDNLSVTTEQIFLNANQQVRDASVDLLAKNSPRTMAGRPMYINTAALPGRADLLDLKSWGKAESKPAGLYTVGNQSAFPVVDQASGNYKAAYVSYIDISTQLISDPFKNAYFDGVTAS